MHTRKQIIEAVEGMTITVRDETNPFSSGNHGYYIGGRTAIGDQQFQISCSIVKVKKKAKKTESEKKKVKTL